MNVTRFSIERSLQARLGDFLVRSWRIWLQFHADFNQRYLFPPGMRELLSGHSYVRCRITTSYAKSLPDYSLRLTSLLSYAVIDLSA